MREIAYDGLLSSLTAPALHAMPSYFVLYIDHHRENGEVAQHSTAMDSIL